MDEGRILIVNLSKGKIGEDNSSLLGAMIITRLQLAAMSRVDLPEKERRDFFLYVDEFQNFATDSFVSVLSEARKYHLSLTLSHQYIGQLVHESNTKVRDAVFGNVGTIICFRVGAADAEFLEKEFEPDYTENDLVNLANYNIYLKLMIDGVASHPFSAQTLPPHLLPAANLRKEIIEATRQKYAVPRTIVEEKIAKEWQSTAAIVEEKISQKGEMNLGRALPKRGEAPPKATPEYRRLTPFQPLPRPEHHPGPHPAQEKKPVDVPALRQAIQDSLHNKNEPPPPSFPLT